MTKKALPCRQCGGPKDRGVRGARLCAECHRLHADSAAQMEAERGRRRAVREQGVRIAGGNARRVNNAPDGQKWCAHCQAFRPLSSFPRNGDRPAAYCKPCQRAYNTERRLLLKFNLSFEDYDAIFRAQGGRCAICEGKPRKYALAVDHDHKTGEVRGLLCSKCNHRLLGSANDSAERLRKAADYLEFFGPRSVLGGRRFVAGFSERSTLADLRAGTHVGAGR